MKRKLGIIIATVVALAGVYSVASVAAADAYTSKDLNCKDFSSQAEAQQELANDPSDPHNLDADDDGQACEAFDYGSDDGDSGDDDNGGGTAPSPTPVQTEHAVTG